jgi:hypothetical protein
VSEPVVAFQLPVLPPIIVEPLLKLKLLVLNVVSIPVMPETVNFWFSKQAAFRGTLLVKVTVRVVCEHSKGVVSAMPVTQMSGSRMHKGL